MLRGLAPLRDPLPVTALSRGRVFPKRFRFSGVSQGPGVVRDRHHQPTIVHQFGQVVDDGVVARHPPHQAVSAILDQNLFHRRYVYC